MTSSGHYLGLNKTFFNRESEDVRLRKMLTATDCKLFVVLGPPSSGKTALVNHTVGELEKAGAVQAFRFNARNGSFSSLESMIDAFEAQLETVSSRYEKLLSHLAADITLLIATLKINGSSTGKSEPPSLAALSSVLQRFAKLPTFNTTFGEGNPVWKPVLIIDEANKLMSLERTDEGRQALQMFLSWIVLETKEQHRFNVVFTSSDSFFLKWLCNYDSRYNYTPLVVGDLTKDHASIFYKEHLLKREELSNETKSDLRKKYEDVYNLVGGRMLHISRYVEQYHEDGPFEDEAFSVLQDQLAYIEQFTQDPQSVLIRSKVPAFEPEDVYQMMTLLIQAKGAGYITEKDLIAAFAAKADGKNGTRVGKRKVDSLVEYDLVHRRPTERLSYDIANAPRRIILTPTSRCALFAMELLLKAEREEQTSEGQTSEEQTSEENNELP